MNSDDDYYVDLYERHAEARANRRARRRSWSRQQWDKRREAQKLFQSGCYKLRHPRKWLMHNAFRISSFAICVFLIVCELIFLRESIVAHKTAAANTSYIHHESNHQIAPSSSTANSNLPSHALSQQVESDKTNPLPSALRHVEPSNSGSAEQASSINATRDNGEREQSVGSEAAKHVVVTEAPQLKATLSSSSVVHGGATQVHNAAAQSAKSVSEPENDVAVEPEARGEFARGEQRRKREKYDSDVAAVRAMEAEPADASSDVHLSKKRASKKINEKMPSGSSDSPPSRQNPESEASERRAEPGAQENFWKWFQESKGSENASSGELECPSDVSRLCQMFYKIVRKYKIRAVFDVSCPNNVGWMPSILEKLGNEIWGFKYYCSESTKGDIAAVKDAFDKVSFVEYDRRQWWRAGFPDDVELVFAWDVLAHTAYGRVWSFFVHARKQDIKYALVDNYPRVSNSPSPKRMYVNLRKHPFRFPAAKEVVQNVTEPGETANRQLLFYEVSMLPENVG